MERRNDLPPTQTIRPMDAPPDSSSPTTAQLKADIDSGRTGDKIAFSTLGFHRSEPTTRPPAPRLSQVGSGWPAGWRTCNAGPR